MLFNSDFSTANLHVGPKICTYVILTLSPCKTSRFFSNQTCFPPIKFFRQRKLNNEQKKIYDSKDTKIFKTTCIVYSYNVQ